jgi:hypothetical protein
MIYSRPRVTQPSGAAPAVSRAIRLTSMELCREKQLMQRSRLLSISQSRRRGVLLRVFEVKYIQYIAFKTVPTKGMLHVVFVFVAPCDVMNPVAQTKPPFGFGISTLRTARPLGIATGRRSRGADCDEAGAGAYF